MGGLFFQITHRDKHRKIRVLCTGSLDARVYFLLHGFPDGIAVRSDDHRATHWAIFCQLSLGYDILIPAREILHLRGER